MKKVQILKKKVYNGNNMDTFPSDIFVAPIKEGCSWTLKITLNSGPNGSHRNIFHKGNSDNDRSPALFLNPNDNILLCRFCAPSNDGFNSNSQLQVGKTHHICMTLVDREFCLYLDGALDTKFTLSGDPVSNNGNLTVGKNPWYAGMNGTVENFRFYPKLLSTDEIKFDMTLKDFEEEHEITSLGKELLETFINQKDCDVKLVLEDSEVKAHKFILKTRSKFFEKALSKDFKENLEGIIELTIEKKYMEILLKFMYCDALFANKLDQEELLLLLKHSDFLQIDILKKAEPYFDSFLDTKSVCFLYKKVYEYNLNVLMKKCSVFIVENFKEICGTKEFLSLPKDLIDAVLIQYGNK